MYKIPTFIVIEKNAEILSIDEEAFGDLPKKSRL
jgi:hypothetical protein